MKTCPRCGKATEGRCCDPGTRQAPGLSVDGVADLVRAMIAAPVDEAKARATRVKSAADGYARAVEHASVATFMARNGMTAPAGSDVDEAALELLCAVEDLPEVGRLRTSVEPAPPVVPAVPENHPEPVPAAAPPRLAVVPPPPAAAEPDPWAAEFPRLRALATARPILLFGGIPVPDKLRWLCKIAPAEWRESSRSDNRATEAAARRVTMGSYGAVILLQELIGHRQSEMLVSAAESSRTLLTYAAKGGQAQLLTALRDVEDRLATAARRAGA
jgi:hypothetical protein